MTELDPTGLCCCTSVVGGRTHHRSWCNTMQPGLVSSLPGSLCRPWVTPVHPPTHQLCVTPLSRHTRGVLEVSAASQASWPMTRGVSETPTPGARTSRVLHTSLQPSLATPHMSVHQKHRISTQPPCFPRQGLARADPSQQPRSDWLAGWLAEWRWVLSRSAPGCAHQLAGGGVLRQRGVHAGAAE